MIYLFRHFSASYRKFFLALLIPAFLLGCGQQKNSDKEATDWVEHGAWRQDLQEKPDPSIDAVTFYTQYHKHTDWWDKAFAFMNRKDLDTLAEGKYPIVGDTVFATVSDYVPKDTSEVKWEAHRNYADIQFLVKGEEKIGMAPADSLEEIVPYNAANDAANYSGPGKYHVAKPGTFFIFFPGQAHRPNLKTDAADTAMVRKIVIKMSVPE